MAINYFELRTQAAKGTDSVAADIMRHLHTRQHLGKAVVITDQPTALLAASRKQWLKLARTIQKQRSSTLNADKILKYTHTITHMQHLKFTIKAALQEADADIYFLDRLGSQTLPLHCYTIYVVSDLTVGQAQQLITQLPNDALIVDYEQTVFWKELQLQPKSVLEQAVHKEWVQVQHLLEVHKIDISQLVQDGIHNIEAMDNALDTLLSIAPRFLRIANEFQRALELSRPLKINRSLRQEYDSLVLLAYRVQALSPGTYTQHFLESYNEDDTFFLYETYKQALMPLGESLGQVINRHQQANRHHLAKAILEMFSHSR